MDNVGGDLKSLESFPIHDINGTALVNEDLGHHEIGDHNGDNHGVFLVDRVDALEVFINGNGGSETS